MAMTLVYHGSPQIVERPNLAKCRLHSDYGRAFYCTFDEDLAREWACEDVHSAGYLNTYAVDFDKLSILDLDDDPNGVLAWIAVLLANRRIDREWDTDSDIAKFVELFGVDLGEHDVVTGYRADDSYFSIARAFVSGTITDIQLAESLRLGELGRQAAFRTQTAIEALSFQSAQRVDPSVWGARRIRRDRKARQEFRTIRKTKSHEGRRIFQILETDGNGVDR